MLLPNRKHFKMRKSKASTNTTTFTRVLAVFALLISVNVSQAWAGQSQDCSSFGDASMICAPISQLAETLNDGTPVTVTNGSTYLATTTSVVKFVFTSNSANNGKNIYLQFFDISQGLSLTLPNPKCSSIQIPSNGCVTAVDSNGSVTVSVSISGATAGKYFKYQLNGPAGFTSGFITTTFTSSSGGISTPEACEGDSTTICAPITRVTANTGGKNLSIDYSADSQDGLAIIPPNTSAISYKFTFPSDYMNKYVFVQFFDVTTLSLVIPGGTINSSTSCDPQPAATRGCKIQIDSSGQATFSVSLSNTVLGSSFKYIVAGPNYASHVVQTSVSLPPTITMTAGKAKLTIKVNSAKGRSLTVSYKVGRKQKSTTLLINSDKALFNIPAPKGTYSVKVNVGSYSTTKKVTVK